MRLMDRSIADAKRVALISSLVALGCTYAGLAQAADGNIKFKGVLLESPCTVSTSAENGALPMGEVSTGAFEKVGDTASAQSFQIKLTDCKTDVASQAAVRFDGVTAVGFPEVLATTGGAKGVGIEIVDDNGERVKVGTASPFQKLNVIGDGKTATGNGALNFRARYIRVGEMTAGTADAAASFTLNYTK